MKTSVLGTPLNKGESLVIAGAGISGLFAGFFLKKAGYTFKIVEKNSRVGGLLNTHKLECGLAEGAANGFIYTSLFNELLETLNIQPVPSNKEKSKKYFLINSNLSTYPLTFSETLRVVKGLISPTGSTGRSVYDFMSVKLGKGFVDKLVSPALGGIYGTGAEELYLPLVFPALEQADPDQKVVKTLMGLKPKEKNKGTYSFTNGMGELPMALHQFLREETFLNQALTDLKTPTLLTVPAFATALLFEGHKIGSLLQGISYSPILSCTVFFKRQQLKRYKEGFGCLVPKTEGYSTMGVLFNDCIFPGRSVDTVSLTAIVRNKEWATLSEEEASEKVLKEIKAIFEIEGEPQEYKLFQYPKGIPVYNRYLYESLKEVDILLKKDFPHVRLFGNYTGQISIRGLCESASHWVNPL